jgi:hypothetical protein
MEKFPENSLIDTTPELFDALSKDFVANPWIVHTQSYSEETKNKLLEGLHFLFELVIFSKRPSKRNDGHSVAKSFVLVIKQWQMVAHIFRHDNRA